MTMLAETTEFTAPIWDEPAQQFSQLIGYWRNKNDVRVRRRFYFGHHPDSAERASVLKQKAWRRVVEKQRQDDAAKRLIADCPRTPPEWPKDDNENSTNGKPKVAGTQKVGTHTIMEAVESYLKSKKGEVGNNGGRGIKATSANGLDSTLRLALGLTPTFVSTASQTAVAVLAGKTGAAAASASVAAFSKGALNMLFWAKVQLAAMVAGVILLGGGAGVATYVVAASHPTSPSTAPPAPPATAPATTPATAAAMTEEQVVAEIKKLGGYVGREGNAETGPVVNVTFDPKMDRSKVVTDGLLEHIGGLNQLRTLWLEGANVTDAGLDHLKGLKQLETLWLNDTKVTDAGLEHLKGLDQLQHLTLRRTNVSDAGLEHLKGLKQLKTLALNETKITDAGLEHLKGLDQLETLLLHFTNVTDAGLVHLKGLNHLRELYLYDTKVTDTGLEYLEGLNQLRLLDCSGTKVTDAGLEHLKGLNLLQTLDLSDTKVTDEGVKKLQEALPKCKITR